MHDVHLTLFIISHCSLKDLHRRYMNIWISIRALVHQDANGTCLPYFRIYFFILAYVIGRWRKDEKQLTRTTQPHSRRRYENPQRVHRSGGSLHESIKLWLFSNAFRFWLLGVILKGESIFFPEFPLIVRYICIFLYLFLFSVCFAKKKNSWFFLQLFHFFLKLQILFMIN